jgi:hypothetical protein
MIGLIAKSLEPLTTYLNKHPNGTVVKVIGDIIAGLLILKGLAKILPDFITGPIGKIGGKIVGLVTSPLKSLAGKVGGLLVSPFKSAAGKIPGALKGAWDGIRLRGMYAADAVAKAFTQKLPQAALKAGLRVEDALGKVNGFFTSTLPGAVSKGGQALKGFAQNGISVISGWGSKVGSTMSGAASAVGTFVSDFGSKLGQAAKSTFIWIGEQLTAGAAFIAENVAEAASATAAYIAENAATLGIIAGITLLVGAIVWLALHWKQVWHDIEVAALWLWHNVLDPMWHGIEAGASWLYNHAIKYYFDLIKLEFKLLEDAALWMWHNVFDPVWHGIQMGADGFESAFKTTWEKLKSIFKDPVNFLINPVYSHIRSLWDGVVEHVGLGKLDLPDLKQFAHGGVIPGYSPGHDTELAMLSPGEGVLVPEAVRAIGPQTVHDLNATYGGGRKSSPGHYSGGFLGNVWHGIASAYHKVADIGKIIAAVTTGNGTALTNALTDFVGTHAVGDYAKMMLGVPKTLITDAVKQLVGMFSGGSSGHGTNNAGGFSGTAAGPIQQYAQSQLARFGWGTNQMGPLINLWNQESSWNPNAVNPSSGAYGIPQALGHGHPYDLGDWKTQVDWGLNYIAGRYGSPASAWAHETQYNWYDQGGWLEPNTMPINGLRRPEAVLTPDQSVALQVAAEHYRAQRAVGADAGGSKQINVNYYGTQHPTPEQKAEMMRDLALALSGP